MVQREAKRFHPLSIPLVWFGCAEDVEGEVVTSAIENVIPKLQLAYGLT